MSTVSDGAAMRQLLRKAFSDAEFSTFCVDHFLPVYEQFSGGMGLLDKIQRLMDYCYRQGQRSRLLKLVAAHNPYQYALYKYAQTSSHVSYNKKCYSFILICLYYVKVFH